MNNLGLSWPNTPEGEQTEIRARKAAIDAALSATRNQPPGAAVRHFEQNYKPTATPAQTTYPTADQVLAKGGTLPTLAVELDGKKLRRVDVKFYFTNPSHVPAGIEIRDRTSGKPGEHSASFAYSIGRPELAEYERVRRGAYDTGTPVVNNLRSVQLATLRRGFANAGMVLNGCFCHKQEKPGQLPKWVVTLRFGWEQPSDQFMRAQSALRVAAESAKYAEECHTKFEAGRTEAIETARNGTGANAQQLQNHVKELWLEHKKAYDKAVAANGAALEAQRCLKEYYAEQVGKADEQPKLNDKALRMLRALAGETWSACHVWLNPDASVTINCTGKMPGQKPKFAIAVRNHQLAVLPTNIGVREEQE